MIKKIKNGVLTKTPACEQCSVNNRAIRRRSKRGTHTTLICVSAHQCRLIINNKQEVVHFRVYGAGDPPIGSTGEVMASATGCRMCTYYKFWFRITFAGSRFSEKRQIFYSSTRCGPRRLRQAAKSGSTSRSGGKSSNAGEGSAHQAVYNVTISHSEANRQAIHMPVDKTSIQS